MDQEVNVIDSSMQKWQKFASKRKSRNFDQLTKTASASRQKDFKQQTKQWKNQNDRIELQKESIHNIEFQQHEPAEESPSVLDQLAL